MSSVAAAGERLNASASAPPVDAGGGAGDHDVIVVGAGPAGLATAALLRRQGSRVTILEASEHVGQRWAERYDRLLLNTWRRFTDLPGLPLDRREGGYPSRDAYAAYLRRYAEHHALPVLCRRRVLRLEPDAARWLVHTSDELHVARYVVLATGFEGEPRIPEWPGSDGFAGRLLHAASYRNAAPFAGADVLVVGIGNTAADVATDLADGGARRVRVAVRTPPTIVPRRLLGIPLQFSGIVADRLPPKLYDQSSRKLQQRVFGDLSALGLPPSPEGLKTHFLKTGVGPLIDGGFVAALKDGRVEVVRDVVRFDGPDVVLGDGSALRPDVVIAATGYARGLEGVVGHLGVLDARGAPVHHGPDTSPSAQGLYFVGLRASVSGSIRKARADARAVAREIGRCQALTGAG